MSINDFLNRGNVNTLWDVISDEDIFKFLSRDLQSKIAELFSNNIKGFFEIERTKTTSLVEINKKYILLILNHIKINYTQQIPNKIKILDETPLKETITYEEIHNERKTQFEKDLMKKQEEFENIMVKKVPPLPDFADKYEDGPISEMDKIIKEITAKRNYDVEQISINNQQQQVDKNWLKPRETSIKTEKINLKEELEPVGNKLKYLNFEPEILNTPIKKSVTWGNSRESSDTEFEENIFKKLKRVQPQSPGTMISNNINLGFEELDDNETNEGKIRILQTQVKTLHSKLDKVIELLNSKGYS